MVATMFCIGVIGKHPLPPSPVPLGREDELMNMAGMYHSGIGGGGLMLVKAADGAFEFVDFRESAPAAIVAMDANSSAGLRRYRFSAL